MMRELRKNLTIILPIAAIVLAFIGYLMEGTEPYHALLSSFDFLGTGAPLEPTNVVIEIARWAGIIFGFSLLFTLLEFAISYITREADLRRVEKRADSVAVHGDGLMADTLTAALGDRAIHSDAPRSLNCRTQVLLYENPSDALDYYEANAKELDKAERVVVNLGDVRSDSLGGTNIYPLNLADICAQQYWMNHPAHEGETILLTGEGSYANALINWGLLANVLSKDSKICYTVVGSFAEYRAIHRRVCEAAELCGDKLEFLDGTWTDHIDVFENADRIIVCFDADESMRIGSAMLASGIGKQVHIHADSMSCAALFGKQNDASANRYVLFGTAEELGNPDLILEESMYRSGKLNHLAYYCQDFGVQGCCDCCAEQNGFGALAEGAEGCVRDAAAERAYRLANIDVDKCLACPRFIGDWRIQSDFIRQSNYAVAVHDWRKIQLLGEQGIDVTAMSQKDCVAAYNALPQSARDGLQEIEHLRWMRLHYLYNWRYAAGKKNSAERTHPCLVAYDELSQTDQVKDADAYVFLPIRLPKQDARGGNEE